MFFIVNQLEGTQPKKDEESSQESEVLGVVMHSPTGASDTKSFSLNF